MNQEAYNEVVNRMKEVVAGKRGFVSITSESKRCGVPKEQLIVVAKSLGLAIQASHGRYGTCASRD